MKIIRLFCLLNSIFCFLTANFLLFSDVAAMPALSNGDIITCDFNNDNKDDVIFRSSSGAIKYSTDLTNWTQMNGALEKYIACDDLNGDGMDDIIGMNNDGSIYYTLDKGSSWLNIPGSLSRIFLADMDENGVSDVLGLNAQGYIYITYNLQSWSNIPGVLADIQPGNFNVSRSGNEFAGINTSGYVYYTTDLYNWTNIPGALAKLFSGEINSDGRADLMGLNSNNEIYYTTNLATWTNIPGGLVYITTGDVNGDGKNDIIGLNSANNIYYTTNLLGWTNIPGALTSLSTGDLNGDGKDDAVGLGSDGNVYYTLNLGSWTPITGDGGGSVAGPYFETTMFFNQDVSNVSPASYSASMIAALRAAGGWGNGDRMQIDFSLEVLTADATASMRTFTPTDEFYTPDCDHVPIPVPLVGNLEGENGYECVNDGDCHLIVFDIAAGKLYEMWRANITSTTFYGGCLAVWDTRVTYSDTLRGDQCTSADAAGFPIAPLLFTADEVAAGSINHAIRFILPNNRIRRGFVRPATHATGTTGGTNAPYYGVHLRLRSDYPVESLPSAGARVVARAMQKYGMYHADGGNIALTAQSDRYTTAKWDGLLGPHDLANLQVEDFEVIDHGSMITLTYDCVR